MRQYDKNDGTEIVLLRCKDFDNSKSLRMHPHDDGKVTFAWAVRRKYLPLFLGEYDDKRWEEVVVGRSCKIYNCSTELVDNYVTCEVGFFETEEQYQEEGKKRIPLVPGIAVCGFSVEPFFGFLIVEAKNECLIWGDVRFKPIRFHRGRRYNRLMKEFKSMYSRAIDELQWDMLDDGPLYLD